jgi:hypothetical protein
MTAIALVLPYQRTSPLHLPRRDLVLDAADSLSLTATVVESDAPDASLIDLATGPTFPIFTLLLWQDSTRFVWDYGGGASYPSGRLSPLSQIIGTISATLPGTVDFVVDAGTMTSWPARCAWAIRMDHNNTRSETLMAGTLQVRGAAGIGSTSLGGDVFTLDSHALGVLA